jgi:hypothetical protein
MRTRQTARLLIAVAGLVLGVVACSKTPAGSPVPSASAAQSASASGPGSSLAARPVWPAPPDPMARAVAAGIKPGPKEYGINHVHAHLDVFVDGSPITVPAGIGINIGDPAVRRFDEADGSVAYGGIQLCNDPCISPLHTHDVTGIIHTESADAKLHTLGQFFIEWGVPLSASCVGEPCGPTVAVYVDGQLHAGDPGAIELTDHREIAIVIGTPPPQIPKTADFSAA